MKTQRIYSRQCDLLKQKSHTSESACAMDPGNTTLAVNGMQTVLLLPCLNICPATEAEKASKHARWELQLAVLIWIILSTAQKKCHHWLCILKTLHTLLFAHTGVFIYLENWIKPPLRNVWVCTHFTIHNTSVLSVSDSLYYVQSINVELFHSNQYKTLYTVFTV